MKNNIVLYLLSILLFAACVKKYEEIDTFEVETGNPSFAIPLINTTLSIKDVLDNVDTQTYLEVDEDGFMTVVYTEILSIIKAEELVNIEDFSISVSDTLNLIPIDTNLISIDVDLLGLKSGELVLSYQSPHDEDLDIDFQINNISKDGAFFNYEKSLIFVGSSTISVVESFPLEGHLIDFQSNQFIISYSSRNAAGLHRPLQNISLEFKNLEYNYLQGFIGQQEVDIKLDTLKLEIFENISNGQIEVEDPKLRFFVENSIGIPLKIKSNLFEGITNDQEIIPFVSDLSQGIVINSPSLSEVGATKNTTLLFDNNTSSIGEFIKSNPNELRYQLSALSHPENDPSIRGFITDESELEVNMEIEIPVWLKATDFTIADTVELDLEEISEIEEAEFKLFTESKLPAEASVQLFFLDQQGVVLDSLFRLEDNFLEAGILDASGRVESSFKKEHDPILFDKERLNRIFQATQVIIKGQLSTVENNNAAVRFYTDYDISLQLGVKALVDVDGE